MNMRASGASRKISHFHILKLLFPSIFVGTSDTLSQKHIHSMYQQQIYVLILRERAPQKHIFSGLKYICIHIESMQFPLITYGIWRYKLYSLPTKH